MKNHRVLSWSLLATICAGCGVSPLVPTPGAIGFESAIAGWRADSTGGSGAHATWEQRLDDAAISTPNVLSVVAINHGIDARFNLYWTDQQRFENGRLSVAVRGDDGVVDQGGGPMWRVQDANNYYVCRFNPLESNYRIYVVEDGVRRQLGTAMVVTRPGEWHRVTVDHVGDHIVCSLDGTPMLDVRDDTITQAGGVGLWTKADARTSFDDLSVSGASAR